MKRNLLAINILGVIVAALLAHVASSEPPVADRVGFPKDYRTEFKVLSVKVKEDKPGVVTTYGNALAASVSDRSQLPFPEGSIIVVEFSYGVRDANGVVQKGDVEHVDVMKRGKNFGTAYGENRAGEWEFAGYKLDGSYATTPTESVKCATCHRGAGAENDFVFRMRPKAATM